MTWYFHDTGHAKYRYSLPDTSKAVARTRHQVPGRILKYFVFSIMTATINPYDYDL